MARSIHSKAKRERELRKQLKRREKEERRQSRATGKPDGELDVAAEGEAQPANDAPAETSGSTESENSP